MQQIRKHGGNLKEASEIYKIPEGEFLDFSANINPLGPPPQVYEVIRKNIQKITQYPDSRNLDLKKSLAKHLNIDPNNVMVGNGASELIFIISNHLRPENVWIPVPTFSEYEIAASNIGANIIHLPLQGPYFSTFNVDKLQQMKKGDLIFICNPNNPTGQLYTSDLLEKVYNITQERGAYLVLDESFLDFLKNNREITFMSKVNNNPYLIILYSLTKFFAIPGLRLGAMIGHPSLIEKFEKVRDPWNINIFAQLAGEVALKNTEYIYKTLEFFDRERKFFFDKLQKISGIEPFKPNANYIFIKLLSSYTASQICIDLAKQGVLVRNCNSYPLLGEKYIRIAIKIREDNLKLLNRFNQIFV